MPVVVGVVPVVVGVVPVVVGVVPVVVGVVPVVVGAWLVVVAWAERSMVGGVTAGAGRSHHKERARVTTVNQPRIPPASRRRKLLPDSWRAMAQLGRAATSAEGAGQVAAVSPEQHSSWLRPNMAQEPSTQAACPWR